MKRLKPLRKRLETAMTRLGFVLLPRLPRRCIVWLSRVLGWIVYGVSGSLRKIGRANLDLAYGSSLSPSEKRHILRESFRYFALTLLDIFWFSRNPAERIRHYVHTEVTEDVLEQGRAAICVTAHMGSWELLGQAVALAGHPLASVATPLINPAVDDYLVSGRTRTGQKIIPRKGAMRGMIKQLKQGGKVALLLDQNTLPKEGGVWVNFYGRPVPVSGAAAALALMTGADILFGFCVPRPDGHYETHLGAAIHAPEGGDSRDVQTITDLSQQIVENLEHAIRERPGAWLWTYKRWKYIPPDAPDPQQWPYYARPAEPDKQT